MEPHEHPQVQENGAGREQSLRRRLVWTLNGCILVLVCVAGYFGYAYLNRADERAAAAAAAAKPPKVIQLDVLNGCGAKGVAGKMTAFLRANGFDVVEMKNYKTMTVPRTLVIDRIGDLTSARRVATALGVPESNIIQQINQDYFVDVSVIIGHDYGALHLTN